MPDAFFAALAWSAPVCIAGLLVVAMFKAPFTRLLDRMKGGTAGRLSFDASGASTVAVQAQEGATPEPTPSPAALPRSRTEPSPNLVLAPWETAMLDAVRRDHPNDNDLQARWLARMYAVVSVERNHERAYRLILGSQLSLLQELNSRGVVPGAVARDNYNSVSQRFPEIYSNFSFENWIGFLTGTGFVQDQGETIGITPLAREFLVYLTANGIPLSKAY